jgi:hypothetical protein
MARPTGKLKGPASRRSESVDASITHPRIVQIAQSLGRMIPDEELRLVPKDLSGQVDHYVYGTPKR